MCRQFNPVPFLTVMALILIWSTPVSIFEILPKKYINLDSRHFCFTRLNATHQIGCSSFEGGNSGVAKLVHDESFEKDMDFIMSRGDHPPYVAIITGNSFNMSTLKRFKKDSSRVAGVVVLDQNRPKAFSSDRSCPNERFSLYADHPEHQFCSKQKWNKPTSDHDDGMLFQHWPFPIFLLRNKAEIDLLIDNSIKYGEDWPKLVLELTSPMSGTVDSLTCLSRSYINENSWFNVNLEPEDICDPLGGTNIFYHTIDSKKLKKNSIVVLSTRLDSFSMFDGISPGSDSVMSSVITILSTAEILNRPKIKAQMRTAKDKSLLIAIFDGEAFDYIGSSQAAFQMNHGRFVLPTADQDNKIGLDLEHLSHFIELDQVAPNSLEPENIFLHRHLTSNIKELANLFKQESQDLNAIKIQEIKESMPLPPSSVQSFLKLRNDAIFKVVVLSNHEREYTNKYYNSFYEDETIFDKKKVIRRVKALSTLVARAVFKLVTNEYMELKVEANETLINMMYECFLVSSSCDFFSIIEDPDKHPNGEKNSPPYSSFVSVYQHSNPLRHFVRAALNFLSGDKLFLTKKKCIEKSRYDLAHSYFWQSGYSMQGECIMSNVFSVDALSPAFNPQTGIVDDELAEQYGVWTESRWKKISLRMYLDGSPKQKIYTFINSLLLYLTTLFLLCQLIKQIKCFWNQLRDDHQDQEEEEEITRYPIDPALRVIERLSHRPKGETTKNPTDPASRTVKKESHRPKGKTTRNPTESALPVVKKESHPTKIKRSATTSSGRSATTSSGRSATTSSGRSSTTSSERSNTKVKGVQLK